MNHIAGDVSLVGLQMWMQTTLVGFTLTRFASMDTQKHEYEAVGAAMVLAGGCRNIKQYPEAMEQDGMLLVRIDSPIYFANVAPIQKSLK